VAESPQDSVSAQLVPLWGKILVGVFLVLVGGVLVYLLVEIWPAVLAATGAAKPSSTTTAHAKTISVFGASYSPDPDVTLLLLVAVLSALGSYVHAAQSFVDFAGNRRLVVSWTWWYIFRILIGVALAEIFYFAIRAGFFGTDTPTTDINPYGIAAIAGLVGLFSKQATDKLPELGDGSGSMRSVAIGTTAFSAGRSPLRSITFSRESVAGTTCWRTCARSVLAATPSGMGAPRLAPSSEVDAELHRHDREAVLLVRPTTEPEQPPVIRDEHVSALGQVRLDVEAIRSSGRSPPVRSNLLAGFAEALDVVADDQVRANERDLGDAGNLTRLPDLLALKGIAHLLGEIAARHVEAEALRCRRQFDLTASSKVEQLDRKRVPIPLRIEVVAGDGRVDRQALGHGYGNGGMFDGHA
jgi:hypothetical protein